MSKYSDMWRNTTALGTDVLWQKVDILRAGIEDGETKEELLADCAKEGGDGKTQMEKFYAVAKVFPTSERADDFDYWTHEVCATVAGVDPDNKETYSIAYGWQGVAIAGYDSKQGRKAIRRKHTARTLRTAIRAASAPKPVNPKPVTVYSGEASYNGLNQDGTVQLLIPSAELEKYISALEWHEYDKLNITLTITRSQPLPESTADGSEATIIDSGWAVA